jgi:ribokinase
VTSSHIRVPLNVSTSRSIVVVGSLNADLVVRVPRFPAPGETLPGHHFARFPGGKGANQAYAAARLGGAVSMIGQVGADDLGAWLTTHLASAGVQTRGVLQDPAAPTGLALITIDATGQNQIVLVAGSNGTFTPARLTSAEAIIASASVVLLQLEIPLDTVMAAARLARDAEAVIVLDPAPAREVPDTLLQLADYVTPNETELAALTGGGNVEDERDLRRRAALVRARGSRSVLVKWGSRGAVLVGQRPLAWPPHVVGAVDTTAAGDAFNGALAVALAEGQSIGEAGSFATAAAAISVTRDGAQPSMPSRDDVVALLGSERGWRP